MEEYQEDNSQIDEEILDEQAELAAENAATPDNMYGYTEPKPIGGLYALFQDVLNSPTSFKVSNVDPKTELGDLGISIRDCLKIALIARTLGHNKFAMFFYKQAGITTETAMSKKGWFTELFITSKKFAEKTSQQQIGTMSSSQQPAQQTNKKRWKLFGSTATPNA